MESLDGVRAVVFDVGETLVDETRMWTAHARSAGVTPFTLMGLIGALIERGHDHRAAWTILGLDPPTTSSPICPEDFYPDALDCLRRVKHAGLKVGIAGNQPRGTASQLRALGVSADFIASSADWNVVKPSPEFFERVISAADVAAHQILYVGDRVDNDILPAHHSGLRTALIRRGPWGYLHSALPEATHADLQLNSLIELAAALPGTR
ncbi:HAD family hydrolase [Mycobacterium sp. AMU20-3851]|uniref:HAD family hydrolase n=1 Tax=Mycobacterium sp. AMU20-3851 TaxID=3122055 RepID=UPI0037553C1E